MASPAHSNDSSGPATARVPVFQYELPYSSTNDDAEKCLGLCTSCESRNALLLDRHRRALQELNATRDALAASRQEIEFLRSSWESMHSTDITADELNRIEHEYKKELAAVRRQLKDVQQELAAQKADIPQHSSAAADAADQQKTEWVVSAPWLLASGETNKLSRRVKACRNAVCQTGPVLPTAKCAVTQTRLLVCPSVDEDTQVGPSTAAASTDVKGMSAYLQSTGYFVSCGVGRDLPSRTASTAAQTCVAPKAVLRLAHCGSQISPLMRHAECVTDDPARVAVASVSTHTCILSADFGCLAQAQSKASSTLTDVEDPVVVVVDRPSESLVAPSRITVDACTFCSLSAVQKSAATSTQVVQIDAALQVNTLCGHDDNHQQIVRSSLRSSVQIINERIADLSSRRTKQERKKSRLHVDQYVLHPRPPVISHAVQVDDDVASVPVPQGVPASIDNLSVISRDIAALLEESRTQSNVLLQLPRQQAAVQPSVSDDAVQTEEVEDPPCNSPAPDPEPRNLPPPKPTTSTEMSLSPIRRTSGPLPEVPPPLPSPRQGHALEEDTITDTVLLHVLRQSSLSTDRPMSAASSSAGVHDLASQCDLLTPQQVDAAFEEVRKLQLLWRRAQTAFKESMWCVQDENSSLRCEVDRSRSRLMEKSQHQSSSMSRRRERGTDKK